MRIEFDSPVTRWDKRVDSWYFATLPEELSLELRELPAPPRGFGSLRVRARIGASLWSTSIFFSGSAFVLPLKRAIRDERGIVEGDVITVDLDIVDL
ncbi:DUF1905 domain-containing protein [Streptomyces sp. AC495_CC817]|uniref:DUF1905 domain-containing protein n=1 Tax=Streptomyces sp. AC495_CC817 TaxID=2823900 RepID=UPI001C26564A|nr:DUF1905 domain-containing protein [Streptomyces sp. AC495_CC817]